MAGAGNRPNRRIAPADRLNVEARNTLAERLVYVGSALHKSRPADYGFHPPTNPRPTKSLCDGRRTILKDEAELMLRRGIMKGMVSDFIEGTKPKYIWCVDEDGEAYEAKIGNDGYHGYCLSDEDPMRRVVLKEWKIR